MEKFSYNPKELTQEQLERIHGVVDSCDQKLKKIQEDEEYMMRNYYDCIDDYSWGGLGSKVNARAERIAKEVKEVLIEEIVRGGYIIRERRVNALLDKETGEKVAEGTHQGKYGRFFVTKDEKFVSCAKQVKTYEKKGYIPVVQTIVEKKSFDGYWRDGDIRYKTEGVISVNEQVSTEIVY